MPIGVWKIARFRKELKALKLGLDGEKAVGQYLERLRANGYQVFHDIPGDNFNIDHVVVGPTGIYTVETKTWSKPTDRNAIITFDGTRLLRDGNDVKRDPIVQCRAQATWLRQLLEESTGRKLAIHPVLVFPGWFVEADNNKGLWVLEPKQLVGFLRQSNKTLTTEEVHLVSFHLSRFVRSMPN